MHIPELQAQRFSSRRFTHYSLLTIHCFPSAFAKPEAERGEEQCADRELQRDGGVSGGEEGFERARDDEHGDDARDELNGFRAGEGDRVAAAQHSGEEDAGSDAQARGPGEEDCGEFESAVRGHEAPQAERHVMLRARDRDDAEHKAVEEKRPEGEQSGGDSAREADEADRDVVGHDRGGLLRLLREDALGPHFVVVEVVEHLLAHEGALEVGAGDGDQRAEDRAEDEDRRGEHHITAEAAQQARVAVGEEVPQAAKAELATGVDEVVGAADEAVEVLLQRARGTVGARGAEVGGGLAIEQAEVAQIVRAKRLHAVGFDAGGERFEAVPVMLARVDPEVCEHERVRAAGI